MFSVIFEKQFCVQYQQREDAPNSRLIDFINEYGLNKRVLINDEIDEEDINYVSVKSSFLTKREQARDYFLGFPDYGTIKKIELTASKSTCCGCSACEQICPKSAITMIADREGFSYPVIDYNLCINCGLCIKTCEFKKSKLPSNPRQPLKTIIAYQNNLAQRMKSRSGGVFVAISDFVLDNDGIVYGADFNSDLSVQHKRAETPMDRDRFCGSKYVQSDTAGTFGQVFDDIKKGKQVLYSGTGCQIAALKRFLIHKGITFPTEKLVLIDIVCHGVMSPMLWQDNLMEIQNKFGGEITHANFRDKRFGWDSHIETYLINGKQYHSDRYTSIFYEHSGLRPSCYNCPYASVEHRSDITLADAWGVKKVNPTFDSSKGVSFVMVNSKLGVDLISSVKDKLTIQDVELQHMMQPNMVGPTKCPMDRNEFWSEYNQRGYSYIADMCIKKQRRNLKKNKIKANIVKIARRLHLK